MTSNDSVVTGQSSILQRTTRESRALQWRKQGLHSGRSLVEEIRYGIAAHPSTRLIFGSQERPAEIEVGAAWDEAIQLASALASLGLNPGDTIVSQLPNWREAVIVFLAALYRGLI